MGGETRFDIAVVGAGAIGLTAALAFAHNGFSTVLVGPVEPRDDGRTVALLDGSVRLLKRLHVWDELEPQANPLAVMRIIDDSGSLFRPPPVSFSAREVGLDWFGWNIANQDLVAGLARAAAEAPNVTLLPEVAASSAAGPDGATLTLAGGTVVEARLVVAADGRRSSLREGAGIPARTWTYPQAAFTTVLAHVRSHDDISTEFHTRHGPFTLVPLPGRRSSLVWVLPPEDGKRLMTLDNGSLGLAIERQAQSMLGAMRIDGPRGLVPMSGLSVERYTAPRLALVGEAAHVFPPIGAQGLNLGFRDAAALLDAVEEAREAGADPGGEALLSRYQRGRSLDVRLRTTAVDMLNRTLLAPLAPADLLRGAGLIALDRIRPLRRLAMREGLAPTIGAPRLMRS